MIQPTTATFLAAVCATGAVAKCETGQRQFMRCSFDNGNMVQVCMSEETATYRYGPSGGTPELALSLNFGAGATAIPWNGTGRQIVDGVAFRNNDVVYEVFAGFDRMFEGMTEADLGPTFGGIVIRQDGQGVLARLECSVGTVDYTF